MSNCGKEVKEAVEFSCEIFGIDWCDLNIYKHPPCMFMLWYLTLGATALYELIKDLIDSSGGDGGDGGDGGGKKEEGGEEDEGEGEAEAEGEEPPAEEEEEA